MINNKFLAIVLSFSFICNIFGGSKASGLDSSQAKNYIQHIINTLFMPDNHSGSYEKALKDFTYTTTRRLLNSTGTYTSYISFSKVYNANVLYQEAVNESIDFIEKISYEYAKDEIIKFYVHAKIDERKIISQISKKIRQEVSDLVNRSSELSYGIFTNYFGVPLKNKVHDMISRELKFLVNSTAKPKPAVYLTPECPICYEKFEKLNYTGNFVKRLILKCGHNMCVECLRSWCKEKGSKANCPICRANINISDFAHEWL